MKEDEEISWNEESGIYVEVKGSEPVKLRAMVAISLQWFWVMSVELIIIIGTILLGGKEKKKNMEK